VIIRRPSGGPAPGRLALRKYLISWRKYPRDEKMTKAGGGLDCRAGAAAL
jgi:hypothetical protein